MRVPAAESGRGFGGSGLREWYKRRGQVTTADAINASGVEVVAPQGLETIIAIYEPAIPQTPEVSVEGALRELELYPAILPPSDLSGVDLANFVDNQFARRAIGQ